MKKRADDSWADKSPPDHAQLTEGLRALGLTEYECRVFLAVLENPQSRVPEIARRSKVPQPKVYAAINRLIERGLCESHLGPINRYSALPPGESFQPLLEGLRDRQKSAVDVVRSLQREHQTAFKGLSRREGRLKTFQGRRATTRKFKELLGTSREEILIWIQWPQMVRDDTELLAQAVARGVTIRMLVELPNGPADLIPEVQQSMADGAEVRWVSELPMRMGIFDRRILILPMIDPDTGDGDGFVMLEVRNESLATSLTNVFLHYWENASRV